MTSPSEIPAEGDDVRRRLLEAAALLLDEDGPDALTARRLAKAGGHLDDGGLHPLRRDAGAGQADRRRGLHAASTSTRPRSPTPTTRSPTCWPWRWPTATTRWRTRTCTP